MSSESAPDPARVNCECKLIAWTVEDMATAMRLAAGDQTSGVKDMATALTNDMAPIRESWT